MKTYLPGMLLAVAMIVSACGGAKTAAPDSGATAAPTDAAMMDQSMSQGEEMAGESMATAEPMMGGQESTPEAMPDQSMSQGEEMAGESMATAEPMMGDQESTAEAMTDQSMLQGEQMTGESMATAEPMMGEHESTPEAMPDQSMSQGEQMTGESMATAEPMTDGGTMSVPAWFGVELTDVNSGHTFKVSDFKGQVVLVETMAVWCTTCLSQQEQIQALHTALGKQDGLVSLSIDIDPNEDTGILKTHAQGHGFDWLFAVAPREVAHEIGQLYGDQFLNPPSAPMFIIDRQGQAHPLPFGVKSASALQEALSPYLN
jgi:cytochrome oxidase Cu insertion factor (SCO1/SenC/PrrC family)